MYKLIAADLDGTLLNSYGEVTENTKKVIEEVQKNKIEFIIASGRPIDSIKEIAKNINSNKYFIAGNGAIIYDIQNDKKIYEKYIPRQRLLKIAKYCEKNNISYNIYTDETIIAQSLEYNVLYYHKENLKKELSKKTNITITENLYQYIKENKELKCLKITICDQNKQIFNSIIKKMKKIRDIDVMDMSYMARKLIKEGTEETQIKYFYTEISAKNVNKWEALKYLAKIINIKEEEIVGIGDNTNDKEMIQNAKLGICMGQSNPKIKEISDYISEDNNNEGVANAMRKYIL